MQPKSIPLLLLAALTLLDTAQAQQRMGVVPGSTVIGPRGAGTLTSRCLDEHERAPWTSDAYTRVLSDDPRDITVKVGAADPVALEEAIRQGQIAITGYSDPGSSQAFINQVRVRNLTEETLSLEVNRFTPIGTPSHGPLGYDVSRFQGLSQRELRHVQAVEERDAPYQTRVAEMNRVEAGQVLTNSIGMRLRRIAKGHFLMGSPPTERGRKVDELGHEVALTKDFFLGVTEVRQVEFQAVMNRNPSAFQGTNLPVTNVSWDEAVEFCRRLTAKEAGTGRVYRLPTEAEWEYGCRAGRDTPYHWHWDAGMPDETLIDEFAWHDSNSGKWTHEVARKRPNRWGLFDMTGNAWEWCSDFYGDYPQGAATDPVGPESGSQRVLRGGSSANEAGYCRSAFRGRGAPGLRYSYLGFRLALTAVE
jgi:formylglycine-generating enzyme required for sulfatase activity